ncbi:hypothetical protein LJ737_22865 [Hymenobacter sp. 15J16-1T3B]|nr:hypothetical protein [Hymenobacter sp. 15J16-1T3B]
MTDPGSGNNRWPDTRYLPPCPNVLIPGAAILFILFGLAFLVLLVTGRLCLGLSVAPSGLLTSHVGFGNCATHLKLGHIR